MSFRRPSRAEVSRYLANHATDREARRQAALQAMADYPGGLPPMAALGWDIGLLVGLEKDGLAVRLPRDRLGDLRFTLNPESHAK